MNGDGKLLLAVPRWSHDRVLFEIESQGAIIPCSVSKAAIQDASEGGTNLPRDLMLQFARLQDRIIAAALVKLRARPPGTGVLHIWSSDLDSDPQPSAPATAGVLQPSSEWALDVGGEARMAASSQGWKRR